MPEYEQPKFIVFYWKLLSLFTMFCFNCREAGALSYNEKFRNHGNGYTTLPKVQKNICMAVPAYRVWKIATGQFAFKFCHSNGWLVRLLAKFC